MIRAVNVKHEPDAQWGLSTIEDLVEDGRAIGYGVLKPGVHVEGGVRLIKSNQVRDGFVDLSDDYRISSDLDEQFKRTRLRGGELLLNVVGSIGRSAIAPSQLAGANVSRAIAVLPLDKKRVQWVQLFLSSPQCQTEMLGRKVGIAQPVLNLGQVRKLTVPIPPLTVQDSIISEVEKQFTRLDAGVTALRRVQANLKRYRAAVLKAACEGRLVPTEAELAKAEGRTYETGEQLLARILADRRKNWHGRGKYKEPAVPDTTNLPSVPEGWAWATFDQVCDSVPDAGKKLPKSSYLASGKFPVIDQGEMVIAGYSDDASLVYEGELPVILFGDHTRRFKLAEQRFVIGADGVKLIGPTRTWDARFLWYQCQQLSFEDRGYSRHFQFVRKAVFRLPPLPEQTRIVAEVERRLSVIEELETAAATNLKRVTRLRQSILQKAFVATT